TGPTTASVDRTGWLLLALFTVGPAATACLVWYFRARKRGPGRRATIGARAHPAEWGNRRALRTLRVGARRSGRLVVGRRGGTLIAAESPPSLLVVGPTQSGKTSGLVIPSLLEWDGPVVATSVKRDLLEATLARRRSLGPVAIFDPSGSSGEQATAWDPL